MSDDPERDEPTADSSADASQSKARAASPPTSDTEPMASETPDDDGIATTGDDEIATSDEQGLRNNVERYVRYLLVAGLSLLALIAVLRFYFAASATIDTWISQEYRSLFQALFNLAIVLLAGAGIGWQARKIR